MGPPARVRYADAGDLRALVDLCRAAVGPGDYVLGYLQEMIAGREAMVTEVGGRVVAMAGVTECVDGALWIGQMRTHPDFRRRGFARRLLLEVYARAARERRPALRLWASRRNVASRTLFETTGFAEVAQFTRVRATALGGAGGLRRTRATGAVHTRWARSAFCRRANGYLAYRWHFVPLTPALLRRLAGRGELYSGGRAAVLAWSGRDDPAAYASILSGGREALAAARRVARRLGRAAVEVFLPRDPQIEAWARASGYVPAPWGTEAVLYEWRVRG